VNIKRIWKHTVTTHGEVRRAFPSRTLEAIEAAVKASELAHVGEIRFAVEAALDGTPLFKGQSPRERAIELFAQLGVWDTEHNNGLLIYVLLADRAVEIVADRGIHNKVGSEEWSHVCRLMKEAFAQSNYERGAVEGIEAVTRHLAKHFPADGRMRNELPDAPVVL
jgi:uncharacterized membrane protein